METNTHSVLELAENLNPEELLPTKKRNEARRTSTGLFRSAWTYVEYALNQRLSISEDERAWHRNMAQYLLGNIINNHNAPQDTILGSMVLSTYLPTLKKRSTGEMIGSGDLEDIYVSLGAAMSYLRPLEIDEPPQSRMEEVVMLALSARTRQSDFLMFPASPREEASEIQSYNHDGYFMNYSTKYPIQKKIIPTNKVYDNRITMMTLAPLFDKVAKKHFGEIEPTLAGKLNTAIACIIAETNGSELTPQERGYLNDLSEAVVAHYRDALKTRSEATAA